MNFFKSRFRQINERLFDADIKLLDRAVKLILAANEKNKKVILAGNGASAAIASHVSVDLTKNAKVRAINFNEADLITCFGNDYGYEKWLEKAIEFYADKGDVVILISSSGKSKNIINAALKAKKLSLKVITLSGFNPNNPLRKLGNVNLWVNSKIYNVVEVIHHMWLVTMVDKLIK